MLSAAQRHTHFLDSPRMTTALGHSDFAFGDLKAETATVFLVLPPDRLGAYARWLRLMVTQSLQDMTRAPGRQFAPVLYLLDEFAALGHLAPVERAMGLMAGYGVQLWPILQDIHQLRANYGQSAGTFLSNAGVLQVFGVNDHDSARLVSDHLWCLLSYGTSIPFTEAVEVLLQMFMLRETNVKDICVELAGEGKLQNTWGNGTRKPNDQTILQPVPITDRPSYMSQTLV